MLKYLKEIFTQDSADKPAIKKRNTPPKVTDDQKLQIATCALFIEVAKADDNFTDSERANIIKAMQQIFDLSKEYVKDLMQLSEESVEKSVSIWEFTDTINKNFNDIQKYQIIRNLWKIILLDDELNQYEDFFIRKISGNLMLSHKDFITAKSEVKRELGISGN